MKINLQFNSQSKSKNILQAIKIAKKLNGEFDGKYYKLFFDTIDDDNLLKLSSLVELLSSSRILIDGEDCGHPYHLEERVDSIVDCYDYSYCNGKCSHNDKFEQKIAIEYCPKFEKRITIEGREIYWPNNEEDLSSPKNPYNKYVLIDGARGLGPDTLTGVEMEEADLFFPSMSDYEEFIPKKKGFELKIGFIGLTDISQIEGLEKLTDLKKLDLFGNEINEIKGLEKLINLEYLNLSRNEITEINGLENLTNLKVLILEVNKIKEIKNLENLVNLVYLDLSENPISEIKGLENLVNLRGLGLNDIKIKEEVLLQIAEENVSEKSSIYEIPDFAQKLVKYSQRKKIMSDREDKEKIQKIEKMLAESDSLRLDLLGDALKMDAHTFSNKILDWSIEYGFEIDGDYLITNKDTVSDFIDELDKYFTLWDNESSITKKKV
ncbi:hypothetical protein LCGC14_0856280 [marine sediment metagenome]|uniref:Leucine-rich repeat domain-containing protein n=1 Tax=marine sediment metagenome TaxID=412755 RepID=A0A0F9PU34_9ZZZZ